MDEKPRLKVAVAMAFLIGAWSLRKATLPGCECYEHFSCAVIKELLSRDIARRPPGIPPNLEIALIFGVVRVRRMCCSCKQKQEGMEGSGRGG